MHSFITRTFATNRLTIIPNEELFSGSAARPDPAAVEHEHTIPAPAAAITPQARVYQKVASRARSRSIRPRANLPCCGMGEVAAPGAPILVRPSGLPAQDVHEAAAHLRLPGFAT